MTAIATLLDQLTPSRRAHSVAVGEAATSRARYVPAGDREDLITAAVLHDIGYAVPQIGFHPIDGARHLHDLGYSPLICHLVATHSAAHLEAAERDLPASLFTPFLLDQDTRAHRAVMMWADLTTSPTGQTCTVTERLEEITHRYQHPHPVARYIDRWKPVIAAAAEHPDRQHPHVLDHPLLAPDAKKPDNNCGHLETCNPQRRTLLLWDVDHTLIDSGGVSKTNYALAYTLLTGHEPGHPARTEGRTDSAIMAQLLLDNEVAADTYPLTEQLAALHDAGKRTKHLLAEQGRALPGAQAVLERCQEDPRLIQSLLTGNIEKNAYAKLDAFGLADYLDFELGAFGHESTTRSDLVAVAQEKATRVGFDSAVDISVVIGDTPRDIEAGLEAGVHTIGIATGAFTVDELLSSGATRALESLDDTDALLLAIHQIRSAPEPPVKETST